MPTQEETASALADLVRGLEDEHMLEGYAAKEAAAVLVQNWTAAVRDGGNLADLVEDVDRTVELLNRFKAAAAALAAPSATPGR